MNRHHIATAILGFSVCTAGLLGCGAKTAQQNESTDAQQQQVQNAQETDLQAELDAKRKEAAAEYANSKAEQTEDTEQGSMTESNTTQNAASASISSDDWMGMQLAFDGQTYTVPFPVKQLTDAGWRFEDERLNNGYILNSGDMLSSTIAMRKDGVDGYLSIGLANTTDAAIDALDSTVWSIGYDGSSAKTTPTMSFAKGVTNGSTFDEVQAAYGEPNDSYISDGHIYDTLEYGSSWEDGYDGKIAKFIFTDQKLVGFTFSQYL